MGNRLILEGLNRLYKKVGEKYGEHPFANVVMAAADVSQDSFKRQSPAMLALTQNVTMYYSSKDDALRGSQVLHTGLEQSMTRWSFVRLSTFLR